MHNLNVRILGPSSFTSTLNELRVFLKFNSLSKNLNDNPNVILFHIDALQDKSHKEYIDKNNCIKICAGKKKKKRSLFNYDGILELPATLKEINTAIDNIVAKREFNLNSSIEIKNYLLNKNEKNCLDQMILYYLLKKRFSFLSYF